MVSLNRLSTEKRAQIIGALVEGNSIRATVRMTGASKNTITKLLGGRAGRGPGNRSPTSQDGTSFVSAQIAVKVQTSP